jgi:esterase/lipase superfamily enzyme
VHYGKVDVSIPKTHRFGSVGSPWWKRWLTLTDDRLAIQGIEIWSEVLFWQNLPQLMELASPVDREALVFLHGFNVDFNEAAIRAAQIGFDLKVPGLTAFFSWPSKGKVSSYAADEATIEASEGAISDFLTRFVTESGATGVHVIAHSMGNRGLLRALQRIHADAERRTSIRFQQIILAAPDLDADLFRDLGDVYAASSLRTTLYASPLDRAVEMSAWLHGAARAGFTPPITIIDGVDTIEVPGFNLLDLGHGYFSEAEAVLHDIFELMHYNENPEHRIRPRAAEDGQRYWSIGR